MPNGSFEKLDLREGSTNQVVTIVITLSFYYFHFQSTKSYPVCGIKANVCIRNNIYITLTNIELENTQYFIKEKPLCYADMGKLG